MKTHGRSYVSNIRVARVEIRTGQIAVTGKRGITTSIGMRFGKMKTCWKEDFVHLALDQLVGATPNLDREEIRERKVATRTTKKEVMMM